MGRNAKQYARRNKWLKYLRYGSYQEYLDGPLWQSIRTRVYKADDKRCYGCGGRAWQVHHTRYTKGNLSGENLNYMVAICGSCHLKAHWKEDSTERALQATFPKLVKMRAQAGLKPKKLRKGKRKLTKKERMALKKKAIWCPVCHRNRRWRGGPCPPCVKASG